MGLLLFAAVEAVVLCCCCRCVILVVAVVGCGCCSCCCGLLLLLLLCGVGYVCLSVCLLLLLLVLLLLVLFFVQFLMFFFLLCLFCWCVFLFFLFLLFFLLSFPLLVSNFENKRKTSVQVELPEPRTAPSCPLCRVQGECTENTEKMVLRRVRNSGNLESSTTHIVRSMRLGGWWLVAKRHRNNKYFEGVCKRKPPLRPSPPGRKRR